MRKSVKPVSFHTPLSVACFFVLLLAPGFAQSHSLPPPVGGITFEDVIKLSRAGLSDRVIVAQVRSRHEPFDLSPDQLIQLQSAHVSEAVIEAMSAMTAEPISMATSRPSAGTPQATSNGNLPSDVGVYVKKKGAWAEVLPEAVNWKTGGVMKNVASMGVVKGDVNGHVNGATSSNRFTRTTEFVIVMPEGREITEYQLLELRQNGNNREFRIVTGGVFHVSSGANRDLLAFEERKVAPRTYTVALPPDLRTGEYGILPPGAVVEMNGAGSRGKLYSFRILE